MLIEVKVPVLSESVTEGTLAQWRKQVGDFVRRDENLIELETDKVMLEIGAPQDGMLAEIKKADGTVVKSNEVIAVIDTEQAGVAPAPKPAKTAGGNGHDQLAPPTPTPAAGAAPVLSPAARKLAAERQIDPASIAATGRGGRVTKEDVVRHVAQPPTLSVQTSGGVVTNRSEQRVPMTRLRARIAERLVEAQHTAAMLTTFNEINMQPVMDLRARYQDEFQKKFGIKLGFMSFFIKASIEALKHYPAVNASIDGNDILYHNYFDIGVAVGTPRGLVVPVIRDADMLTFGELETVVAEYAKKAREGKLGLEELSGGTFSITNGGVFGSLLSTPILNPPQCAILGMHKIEERAVVIKGEIVARPMMYLALSYDHRLIDGQEAVRFLVAIKEALEDPARMLLQV